MSNDERSPNPRNPSITNEAIKERVTVAPFRPFSVRLTDGRSYPVPGPDYASVSPNGRLLSIYTDGGNGVKILDVALITEIEITAGDKRN